MDLRKSNEDRIKIDSNIIFNIFKAAGSAVSME